MTLIRKGKTLPRIHADERGSGKLPEVPKLPKIAEIEDRTLPLINTDQEEIAEIAVIAVIGKARPKPLTTEDTEEHRGRSEDREIGSRNPCNS
jgi:hypothetical protein